MAYPIETGLQISLDYNKDTGIGTWYKITDHNRQEIQANPEIIGKESRMANGTMRKYIVATKTKVSTSWNFIPVKTSETVDGAKSAGWLSEFYNANVYRPIWIKLVNAKFSTVTDNIPVDNSHISSKDGGADIFQVFITNFSTTTIKRTSITDYVNMDIEFTEI